MRRTTFLLTAVVAATTLLTTSCSADLGTLGGASSAALGIGPGQVVGSSTTATGAVHAFVYDLAAEEMHDLGTLTGVSSVAHDVGPYIVGSITTADGRELPALWTPSNAFGTTFPIGPHAEGSARGIGSTGFTAGWVVTATGPAPGQRDFEAVVWDPDGFRYELGYLPRFAPTSMAADVNATVQVVGVSGRGSCCGAAGFVWDLRTKVMRELPGVQGAETHATAINDAGTIVGWAVDPTVGSARPATWDAGAATLAVRFLPDLGGGARLSAVNEDGMAIGSSRTATSLEPHGFCVSLRTGRTTDLGPVQLADIAPDGWIVGTDEDGHARIWSADTCRH